MREKRRKPAERWDMGWKTKEGEKKRMKRNRVAGGLSRAAAKVPAAALCLLLAWSALFLPSRAAGNAKASPFVAPKSGEVVACGVSMGFHYTLPAKETARLNAVLEELEASGRQSPARSIETEPVLEISFQKGGGIRQVYSVWEDAVIESGDGRDSSYTIGPGKLAGAARALSAMVRARTPDNILQGMDPREDEPARVFAGLYYWWGGEGENLEPAAGGRLGKKVEELDRAEFLSRAWKATYTFYERGVGVSLSSRRGIGGIRYPAYELALKGEGYSSYLNRLREDLRGAVKRPAWLGLVNADKITRARAYEKDGTLMRTADDANVIDLVLKSVDVEDGSGREVSAAALPDARRIEVDFENGVRYTLYYTDQEIAIASSDMTSGVRYRLNSTQDLPAFYSRETLDYFCETGYWAKRNPGTSAD